MLSSSPSSDHKLLLPDLAPATGVVVAACLAVVATIARRSHGARLGGSIWDSGVGFRARVKRYAT